MLVLLSNIASGQLEGPNHQGILCAHPVQGICPIRRREHIRVLSRLLIEISKSTVDVAPDQPVDVLYAQSGSLFAALRFLGYGRCRGSLRMARRRSFASSASPYIVGFIGFFAFSIEVLRWSNVVRTASR